MKIQDFFKVLQYHLTGASFFGPIQVSRSNEAMYIFLVIQFLAIRLRPWSNISETEGQTPWERDEKLPCQAPAVNSSRQVWLPLPRRRQIISHFFRVCDGSLPDGAKTTQLPEMQFKFRKASVLLRFSWAYLMPTSAILWNISSYYRNHRYGWGFIWQPTNQ